MKNTNKKLLLPVVTVDVGVVSVFEWVVDVVAAVTTFGIGGRWSD